MRGENNSSVTFATRAVLGVIGVILTVYCCVAGVLIQRHGPMADTCKNQSERQLFPTTISDYVLTSALAFVVIYAVRFVTPIFDAVEALVTSLRRLREKDAFIPFNTSGRPKVRYGVQPNLPDWLLLAVGVYLLFEALVYSLLAFWGYHQLFRVDPWCVGLVQYEEIPLWEFGHTTQIIQVALAVVCGISGTACLLSPIWLEYVDIKLGNN